MAPLKIDLSYMDRRRGSVVESRTDANNELVNFAQKQVKVRTPRRGRSKSIVIIGPNSQPRNFPVGRLNNYTKTMKKHKGPVSMLSELESIDEGNELSDKLQCSSSSQYRVGEPMLRGDDRQSVGERNKDNSFEKCDLPESCRSLKAIQKSIDENDKKNEGDPEASQGAAGNAIKVSNLRNRS